MTSHGGKTPKKKTKEEKKVIRKRKSNEGITLQINELEKQAGQLRDILRKKLSSIICAKRTDSLVISI